MSGDIRSMVTFNLDGGKMYGFDVKATDSEGSENGNSATTTVFVSYCGLLGPLLDGSRPGINYLTNNNNNNNSIHI